MRIASSFFDSVIDTENGFLNTLVIENPHLFYSLVSDVTHQMAGEQGRIIISEKDKPCVASKKVELLDRFVPFDINTRTLLSRLGVYLERTALSPEQYETGMQLLSEIEDYMNSMSLDLPCDVVYTKLNIGSLIKALGIEFRNDYHSLAEQILDYMELVRELEGDKLFILVNARSYVSDKELEVIADDLLLRKYHIVLIDSFSRRLLKKEKRITIDDDLCEI